jgi:eukaryotic-like serine/threonine-protein kinase
MTELRDQLQGTLGAAYSLERELGGGGMSRVFVATETALGRTVVVKVLPPDLVGGVNIDRFRREVRLAAGLRHPNIVPVLAAGEMDGVPYYTMPFLPGQSLRARLFETGALPLDDAVTILRDVARALEYAHAHGVVHRDIKPDNVLFDRGAAMVTDFGIAKAISTSTTSTGRTSLTMSGTSIGTPAYMAPEQATADPATDHRADIYSFGCMAYELLTGEPPFAEVAPHRRLAAQISGAPVPISSFRPDVPRALQELVARCLQPDPAQRPQRAEALIEVLDSVMARRSMQLAIPSTLLVPVVLGRALTLYLIAALAMLLLARAAIAWIGLPDWVLVGVMIVLALGLPVVLLTAWAHYVTHRAASEAPLATTPPKPGRLLALGMFVLERVGRGGRSERA